MTTETVINEWDVPLEGMESDRASESAPESAPERDEEAPWGRRADGTPRGKPGPKNTGTRRPAAPKPKGSPSSAKRKSPSKPDYRTGVLGTIQLIAAPLVLAGRTNKALMADAAALTVHAESIADGAQTVAENDARVAALLDRVMQVGPYAAILAPAVALFTQLAVNHGIVPVEIGTQLGAAPPDLLIQHVTGMPAAA